MYYSRKSLYEFLYSNIDYQLQANFEFRYPTLFGNDSFLVDQIDFPHLDKNTGDVWVDGFRMPVHSTAKFDNEIKFTMYVENDFLEDNGKYKAIFDSLLSDNYDAIRTNLNAETVFYDEPMIAKICPVNSNDKDKNIDKKVITLYNALIKSISLDGGFSANSITISKFTVSMTYSFFEIR